MTLALSHKNGRAMPAHYGSLWLHVAAIGRPMNARELGRNEEIATIVRHHHSALPMALNRLVEADYLRTDKVDRFQATFWYSTDCRRPDGAPRIEPYIGNHSALAQPRVVTATGQPIDRSPLFTLRETGPGYDFRQCPSRRGNRLYFRSGLVTDLEGNPLEGVTA